MKKPRLNWMNVLEQALGTILATAIVAAIGYLYNISRGTYPSSRLIWYIPIPLVIIILLVLVWQKFRNLITAVGQFVVRNWQLVVLFFLTLLVAVAGFIYTRSVVPALVAIALVITTFFLMRSRFSIPASHTIENVHEAPATAKAAKAQVHISRPTPTRPTEIVEPDVAINAQKLETVYQELDLSPKTYARTLETAKDILRRILKAELTSTQRRILVALIEKTDESPIARRVIESSTGFDYMSSEFYEEMAVLAHYDLAYIRDDELSLIYFPNLEAWTFIKALCERSGLAVEKFLRDPRIELIS